MAAATSLDGRISDADGRFHRWGSAEDHHFIRDLIERHDALVIGRVTYEHMLERGVPAIPTLVFTRSPETHVPSPQVLFVDPASTDLEGQLAAMGAREVLVLGGTQTYTYFLEQDLLSELYITVEPIIFGCGKSLFESTKQDPIAFTLEESKLLNPNGTMLLRYARARRASTVTALDREDAKRRST